MAEEEALLNQQQEERTSASASASSSNAALLPDEDQAYLALFQSYMDMKQDMELSENAASASAWLRKHGSKV